MRKILIFIAVAVLSIPISTSQELRLGAKAGLNVASFGGPGHFGGLSSRASFHVGGLVEIPLIGKFSIQPELLYSSQGGNYDYYFGFFDAEVNGDIKLNYIAVPVIAKFYIIDELSAEAGPVFNVLVSAEKEIYDSNKKAIINVDAKDDYKSFDAAIGIGASYRLNTGVFFNLRYNIGLLNINEDYVEDDIKYKYKNQNNVFQISAGYSF